MNTFLRVHAKWWALLLSLSLTLAIGALAQNWGFIPFTPAEIAHRLTDAIDRDHKQPQNRNPHR